MKGKAILRELAMEIGFLILIVGILLLFFSTFSLFFYKDTPQIIKDLVKPLHDSYWDMWAFFFGILMVLIGALMFGDKVMKLMEFKRLLKSPSRAAFLKNRERLELLAYKLTKRQEDDLEKKLIDWKIKD